jgi:hypothetical protein
MQTLSDDNLQSWILWVVAETTMQIKSSWLACCQAKLDSNVVISTVYYQVCWLTLLVRYSERCIFWLVTPNWRWAEVSTSYVTFTNSTGKLLKKLITIAQSWLYSRMVNETKRYNFSFDFCHSTIKYKLTDWTTTAFGATELRVIRKRTSTPPQSLLIMGKYSPSLLRTQLHRSSV